MPAVTILNIENFSIQNVSGQALSIDFAGIDGEANVASNMSTSAFAVTNLAAGTSFDVVGNGAVANSTSDIGYVATAGAGDLDIMNGVTGGAITITGTGLLSQSITSTGAANTVGAITLAATTVTLTIDATTNLTTGAITDTAGADAMTTIVITGAGAVDIDAADLEAEVTTVNASGATGALSVAIGDVADAGAVNGVDLVDATITGGAGNDSINVDALVAGEEVNVNAGAGNDTVTIGEVVTTSGAATVGDVLNGGEGTDTLAMTTAIATAQTAATTVSNFEAITVSNAITGGTLDVTNFQATGINTVNLAAGAGAADTGVVTFGAGANTLNIAAANAGTLTVNDTGTATTDTLSINNTATTQTDVYADEILAINGFETVNISTTSGTGTAAAQDFAAITLTVDTGGTGTVNFSGANVANINGIVTAHALSFAGMTAQATGTATADMTGTSFEYAGATGSGTITGSAGDDVLVGDTGESTNIDGGAGNDNITGGSAAETLSGGEGNDTIAGGGGADTLNGGAGNDTITLGGTTASAAGGDGDDTVVAAGNLTFGTTVVGGAGTDAISITAAVIAANGSVVSGFETLVLGGNINQDLDNFGSNTFSTVSLENDTYTVTSVRSQVIQLTAALGGASTITLEDATGTTDSVTVQMSSAADLDATNLVTIAGVETINLVMVDSNTTAHVNTIDLVADSATRLVVSGNAGLNFATNLAEDIADVVTMDASGVVLGAVTAVGITYAATYNTVGGVTTITGSNGVDALTGGAATNDTISGGAGVDTITYTGGSDTFTGGAGNDVFDINATGTSTAFVTITDATAGDTIAMGDRTFDPTDVSQTINVAAWNALQVTLGAAATLANYLDAASTADGTNDSAYEWFEFGGNSYIVISEDATGTFTSGTDTLIVLTGTGILDGASMLDATLTLA
jgi:S-layer protein